MTRAAGAMVLAVALCVAGALRLGPFGSSLRASGATMQSVDDIVQKNLTAKGGLARLKAINTIKQTAILSMQGSDAVMTIYSKRPDLLRQELSVGGQVVINGFDGQNPWILNPNVSNRAIVVTGPQADQIKEQSSFDGPLVDYKGRGYTVAMNGFEMMGDRRVIHLRMTSMAGQRSDLYLDAETYLDAKVSTRVNQLLLDQEMSDYRDVKGIKVPYLIRTVTNGVVQSELKVQTVEFDVPMNEALFRVPKSS